MLILVSLILKSLLFLITNCCALLSQSCSERTRTVDLYKRYFTLPLPLLHEYNVLCFVHKFIIVILLYQLFLNTTFIRTISFMFMALGLMTCYICTLLIHHLAQSA